MTTKFWSLTVVSFLFACGQSGGGNIPVPTPDVVHHTDGGGGGGTNQTFTPPPGDPIVCDTVLDQTNGHSYPFQGLTSNGKTITCTACPTGFNKLNDQWLWFAEDENGNIVLDLPSAGYKMISDELTFNGNTFVEVITSVENGSVITQRVEGYFVCPTPEEMPSLQFIWVVTKAEPEGLFGNKTGDMYPYAQLDSTAGVDDMMLWFDYDWSGAPPPFQQAKFCRRGKIFSGTMCEIP